MTTRTTTSVFTLVMLLSAAAGLVLAADEKLTTEISVLVGFPSTEQEAGGGVVLVPGTVLPVDGEESDPAQQAQQDIVKRSLSFARAVEKLWTTFRLDPERRVQSGRRVQAVPRQEHELPVPTDETVKVRVTLQDKDEQEATYRVVFLQAEGVIADSTVTVARGGRAVVGGMDGKAAPYLFVFVQPDPPHSEAVRFDKELGLSQPEAVHRPAPTYPEQARRDRVTGVVVLDTVIAEDGSVLDVSILESPVPSLAQAAVEAVRQWKFKPARTPDGKAVMVSFVITVSFTLK